MGCGESSARPWKPVIVTDPSAKKIDGSIRLMLLSDTHTLHESIPPESLPEVDIVLHCGDFTYSGRLEQVRTFRDWFLKLKCRHRILIAGNHELSFDVKNFERTSQMHGVSFQNTPDEIRKIITEEKEIIYLEHEKTNIMGLNIFGSPYSPEFGCWAFPTPQDPKFWESIPIDTDILITHGPPYNILDLCTNGLRAGDKVLSEIIKERKIPLVSFGHIHETFGHLKKGGTLYINASNCNYHYECVNKPYIIDMVPL